jgi:hypothetical protein
LTWFIVIFVIAVALSPLLHFAPSKAQRRVAGMREQAALAGLFVEFREIPRGVRQQQSPGRTIYYGKRLRPPRKGKQRGGVWVAEEQGWRAANFRQEVPQQLASLPASVTVAGVDSGSCGVYWQEAGEGQDVAVISEVLDAWAASLCN